ncbi:Protein unc-80 [Cichlidogyrus casuarinus]|uniref:Protein unc-80 n=1 Tax=Cichlidogyrus casuarinus TaxID=1844966 RepID=A0ABD2QGF4_9PLAT
MHTSIPKLVFTNPENTVADCPVLSKENIFYALDACITAWFACNTDDNLSLQLGAQKNSTSGSQPAGGSVSLAAPFVSLNGPSQLVEIVSPTSFSCDHPSLRADGESASMKTELVQRLGYLGVKLILIAYPRHALARSRRIIAALTKMSHCQHGGLQLWKFVDFLVTYRPPIFPHLLAFIHLKMAQLKCESQGEQAFQQVVNQKLIGLHMPPPKTPVNVLRVLMNDLRQIRIEFTQTRRVIPSRSLLEVSHQSPTDPLQACDSELRVLSNRKSKTHDHAPKPSCKVDLLQIPESALSFFQIIPSLASDSAATSLNEAQQGPEAMFGLPTSTHTGNKNLRKISLTDSNNIRKCLLRQRSGKRIKATDGSRIICRHQSLSNRQPILTASVESLPRNSYNYANFDPDAEPPESAVGMGSKLRRAGTSLSHCGRQEKNKTVARLVPIATAVPVGGPTDPDGTKSDSLHLTNPAAGHNATELVATSGNFTVAAHVAQSLFGSAAPYNRVRETAKDELCHLMVGERQDELEDKASLSGPEVAEILEAQAKKEIEERSKTGQSASSVLPVVRYV